MCNYAAAINDGPHGVEIFGWSTALVTPEDQTVLSTEERHRAARFIVPGAAGRYIAARAGMRRHLARYLGVRARDVHIKEAAGGKPYLPDAPQLHFSLSHSGTWALLACSDAHAVGVDMEALVDVRRITSSLQHLSLCPNERAQLMHLPAAQHSARFTRWWTAKESIMKLCGLGLQLPPTAIEIVIEDEETLYVNMASAWRRSIPAQTTLRTLDAPEGYVATLAVAHSGGRVREADMAWRRRDDVMYSKKLIGANRNQSTPSAQAANSSSSPISRRASSSVVLRAP